MVGFRDLLRTLVVWWRSIQQVPLILLLGVLLSEMNRTDLVPACQ